ncbi:hypothetical protein AAV80_11710 [Salmonella enterica subsp. enterica serovar Kentucky]|nr:hypothetical protein [Salmonella enterica subsp. enterica serovar Kentucky]
MRNSSGRNIGDVKSMRDFDIPDSVVNSIDRADLEWFREHPTCIFRIRRPEEGEYPGRDPNHDWYVIARLVIEQNPMLISSNDGGQTGRSMHYIELGHIPVLADKYKGSDWMHTIFTNQTKKVYQKRLCVLWENGLAKLGAAYA